MILGFRYFYQITILEQHVKKIFFFPTARHVRTSIRIDLFSRASEMQQASEAGLGPEILALIRVAFVRIQSRGGRRVAILEPARILQGWNESSRRDRMQVHIRNGSQIQSWNGWSRIQIWGCVSSHANNRVYSRFNRVYSVNAYSEISTNLQGTERSEWASP